MDVDALLSEVTRWAAEFDGVIALALVGSHARGTARTDSDVDLVLVARDPDALLADTGWLGRFGDPAIAGFEDWGLVQSCRVRFDTLEVEFGITGIAWVTPPIDSGTAGVLLAPIRALHDPAGLFARAATDAQVRHG